MDERGGGWRLFAAFLMFTAGIMRIFDAIWSFSYHAALPERFEGAPLGKQLATYGWIYLVGAALLFLGGVLVINRSPLGRWIGILAGAFTCISAALWLPYYPVWSLAYITLGALVIYALAVYGGRSRPDTVDPDRQPARPMSRQG